MIDKLIDKIPLHIRLLIKLYFLNLTLFFVIRILFYLINQSSDLSSVPLNEKLMAFRMGLEFDTAVFCWIVFLPTLIFSIAYFLNNNKLLYKIGFYSFLFLLIIYYLVAVANIPYYTQFGSHLSKNAFLWEESPVFVIGMIFGSFNYWGYLLLFFLFVFILIKVSNKFYKTFLTKLEVQIPENKFLAVIYFVALACVVTIGARGRSSDRSGLHEGLSIVSQNAFVNQVAINPNFPFWRTVLYERNNKPYKIPIDINDKINFTRKYLGINSAFKPNIDHEIKDSLKQKYNFVIVVMESMSVFKMGYYNGKNLTPHLDKLIKESVFFNNFFSSGIHTFNGLFSTTAGFPSILAEKSMKSYVKKPFHGIGPLLKAQGYETYFYTTHDPHFDNMQGFFKMNLFDHFISQYDFDFSQAESSLGVPDHLLFDKLLETIQNRKSTQPFLSVLMTASDHGPWKIPQNIPFKPNGADEKENCTLYADWAIGRLMEQAKKMPWYKNTVFMFLGDHGLSLGHTYEMPLAYNHVPFIIHQPAVFKVDTIASPTYQPDIPATVMGIIGANYINQTFGINILKEKHPYVVFSADDKIGCVDSNGYYFYRTLNNNQNYLRKYKNLDSKNYVVDLKSKADSMSSNMLKIYESAQYLIMKDYYMY